ncbi:MAG: UTP--glucose-1-phosphate uridylyltransferase [Parachlamydiales bacterium]|jgi:hypothetical protein
MGKSRVAHFFKKKPELKVLFDQLSPKERAVLEKLIDLGEGPVVFRAFENSKKALRALKKMAFVLLELEHFYSGLGGIEGYFKTFLKLLKGQKLEKKARILKPAVVDITKKNAVVEEYIREGLKNLPLLAEIYPVGGSGDRLKLTDVSGKKPLPVACLPFLGRSLLEGLVRDLQAREYLYFKTFHKKIVVPVILMTSGAKDNHQQILKILKQTNYFQRPKESFLVLKQVSVPMVNASGHLVLKKPLELMLKPGGHGVIWKLMEEKGVFQWLKRRKREKLLIRQINNPVAGLDFGLLAFYGYGCREKKAFGFASCPRLVNAAEGTNVLKAKSGFAYNLSNIEYTDFKLWGLKDEPRVKGSIYSKYPANTNLLFADLKEIKKAVKKCPYPGLMINLKNKVQDPVSKGEIKAGRLELMMQNIADAIEDRWKRPLKEREKRSLKTFLTYGERKKTISSTKRILEKGKMLSETPEGAFFDYLRNMEDLFRNFLGFTLPSLGREADYLEKGPGFSIILNPALGPLFSLIAKKISLGRVFEGSELLLDLAEAKIQNLTLDGSFLVEETVLGGGRLFLKNVKIQNGGIDREKPMVFWKRELERKGEFYLKLNRNSEFVAENIVFRGAFHLEVLENERATAFVRGGRVVFKKEKLKKR